MLNATSNTIKAKDALPGRWYYDQQYGFRLLCTHNHPPSRPVFVVNHAGSIYRDLEHRLTPLPDCTGWDWEPTPKHSSIPDPGEGWRIASGNDYKDHRCERFLRGRWTARALTCIGEPFNEDTFYRVPVTPQYRPFANAEEFDPLSDRIVINIGTGTRRRIDHWGDKGCNGMPWDMAFRKYTFLDGTPFGIKIDDEQGKPTQSS